MAEGLTLIQFGNWLHLYTTKTSTSARAWHLFLKPQCLDKIYKTDDSNSQKIDWWWYSIGDQENFATLSWLLLDLSNPEKRQNTPILKSGDAIYIKKNIYVKTAPIYRPVQCFRAYLDQTNSFPTRVLPHHLRVVPKTQVIFFCRGTWWRWRGRKRQSRWSKWSSERSELFSPWIHRKGGIPSKGSRKRRQKLITTDIK